jgi:hypothetical protein
MADWTFAPQFAMQQASGPPPTLQTVLDDGKVISRVKHTNSPETWTEEYLLTGAEFDTAKAFYDTKGVATSFTKVAYDVHGSPTTERTVRFNSSWSWQKLAPNVYKVSLVFVRHY